MQPLCNQPIEGNRFASPRGCGLESLQIPIRRLCEQDRGAIRDFYLSLSVVDRHGRFHTVVPDDWIISYVHRMDIAGTMVMGAFCPLTGRLIGLVEACPTEAQAPRAVEIAVIVKTDWRRLGLGRRLVRKAVRMAFALGMKRAELSVMMDDSAIIGLIHSLNGIIDPERGLGIFEPREWSNPFRYDQPFSRTALPCC